jgi:hypothetical protein
MVICPEAIKAQNKIAAVSAEGRTVWVLIRRLNSSCKRHGDPLRAYRMIQIERFSSKKWLRGREHAPASIRLLLSSQSYSL